MSPVTAADTNDVADHAHTVKAEANRKRKAEAIAVWCWPRGITGPDLTHASPKRRLAVARAALNPSRGKTPRQPSRETWDAVTALLDAKSDWADDHPDDPRAARPAVGERANWVDLPKGWAELAQMPPLGYGHCVHHARRRPVVTTLEGGRCGDCPPRPFEFETRMYEPLAPGMSVNEPRAYVGQGRRDGWGIQLNWTPKRHLNGRCYCGRCPEEPQ